MKALAPWHIQNKINRQNKPYKASISNTHTSEFGSDKGKCISRDKVWRRSVPWKLETSQVVWSFIFLTGDFKVSAFLYLTGNWILRTAIVHSLYASSRNCQDLLLDVYPLEMKKILISTFLEACRSIKHLAISKCYHSLEGNRNMGHLTRRKRKRGGTVEEVKGSGWVIKGTYV